MEGPNDERPTLIGSTLPSAARARTAESQLRRNMRICYVFLSCDIPFMAVLRRDLEHTSICEDTTLEELHDIEWSAKN